MKKYLPALVAGFGAGVLAVVPIVKSFSCCLIIPFAAIVALILDQKANKSFGEIETSKALMMGLMTGIYAAVFGTFFELLITFITKNNDLLYVVNDLKGFIDKFPVTNDVKQQVLDLTNNVVNSIKTDGFSLLYSIALSLNNLIINPIFGMIGALIGAKFINSRANRV